MNANQSKAYLARIDAFAITRNAVTHAENCLESRSGWDIESLGYNIECNFPEIDSDKCDAIAAAVMRKASFNHNAPYNAESMGNKVWSRSNKASFMGCLPTSI